MVLTQQLNSKPQKKPRSEEQGLMSEKRLAAS
jgi:hypothetical protein